VSRVRRFDLGAIATGWIVWTVPILVIGAIYYSPRHIASPATVVTALIGLIVVLVAAQRPDLSLLGLILFLPFQGLVLAKLWDLGMPASVVSHLGAWKEALALGVIVAGLRNLIATRRRLDVVDRLALLFVALTIGYALLQPAFLSGSPTASNIRLLGFRETGGFVLLLFGARHAPFPAGFARRAGRAVLIAGGIVAAVGLFEATFSAAWNSFVVHAIKYPRYQADILHTYVADPGDIRVYGIVGGARIVRIGSVFLNQLTCGWYLILPFAVGLERAVRRTASPPVLVTTAIIGAALLLTQTRSAILGALIVAFLAFQPAAGRGRHWRTRVAILLAALAVVAVPAIAGSGLSDRIGSATSHSDQSTAGHLNGFSEGVDTVGRHPLGLGLGTGAGTGQRFAVHGDVIAENNYLEIGDELGIVPMLVFVALTLAVLLSLRRLSRGDPDPLTTAVWAGGVGLAFAAWFLQTWGDFAVAWTFWGLAGATFSVVRQKARVSAVAPVARPARAGTPRALPLRSAAR
jgi:hypothetical protein